MVKVFISYKVAELNNALASELYNYLEQAGFDVFLDKRQLYGGTSWDNTIYEEISNSDVLLVLITEDAFSPWVQREVDFARGCRIKILPVVVRDADLVRDQSGQDNATKVMERLAISDLQFARALSSVGEPKYRYLDVVASIHKLVPLSRKDQQDWVESLRKKWAEQDKINPKLNPPGKAVPKHRSFVYISPNLQPHKCRVHIAAGDITQMRGIDVLVNSENVYMQMQRVFAAASVSKTIRMAGAKGRGVYIEEDTIQSELNERVFTEAGWVPVQIGDVFVTSAGRDGSELRKQGTRYVFHVAAVDAHPRHGELRLNDSGSVKKCVENCFHKLDDLNGSNDKVTSIIFPILGTGNGGLPVREAVAAILDTFKEYLTQNTNTYLDDLYLNAFTTGDIEEVEQLIAQDGSFRHAPINQ